MRAARAVLPLLLLPLLILSSPAAAKEKRGETFYPGRASIESFPREVPLGGSITFKVTVKSRHHTPVLAVIWPDGRTEYLTPTRTISRAKHEFDVVFKAGKGAYRIELVVDSERGDTTAAQFTIYVGVKRPERLPETKKRRPHSDYGRERRDEDTLRLERNLFLTINEYREEIGLEPYPWLEKAAYLAREHWRDWLELDPRPDKFSHLIAGAGSIADRLMDVFAWPWTVRKFPVKDPEVGPEATSYCSEALGASWSLDWIFREYLIRESAFRAPLVSEYPTHAAVGMIREEKTGLLYAAVVYVQVNSLRVRRELGEELKEIEKLEARATKDETEKAEYLRRLGRFGDPASLELFVRRLSRSRSPVVRAAALDALFLNAPDRAAKWIERQTPRLVRAHRNDSYAKILPALRTFAEVRYDAFTRARGRQEVAYIERLSETFLKAALRLLELGATDDARTDLELIVDHFAGLPAADRAREVLDGLEREPGDGSDSK
jgi:hypothetical protein